MPNLISLPTVINSNNNPNGITLMAYDITNINEETTEIAIYDYIASKKSVDWWTGEEGTEVTPKDFKEQLEACQTKNITIRMNSGGGDVNAANVISVAIEEARNKGKKFTCMVDGLCASAAVQIATSCDEVVMYKGGLLMIHNPMVFCFGYQTVNDAKSIINMLTATKNAILNHYIAKTGLSKQKLSNMMDEETWMDAKEAVDKGFADKMMFNEDDEDDVTNVINRVRTCINSTSFKNIPEMYKTPQNKIQPMEKGEQKVMPINTVEELEAQYPELTNQIRTNAINSVDTTEAVNQERERIKAIDELSGKVSNELLNKAKYETLDTAEAVAMEALKTGAFVQPNVLNALEEEGKDTEDVKGLGNDGNKTSEDEANEKKEETKNRAAEVALNHLKNLGKVK